MELCFGAMHTLVTIVDRVAFLHDQGWAINAKEFYNNFLIKSYILWSYVSEQCIHWSPL